MEELIAQTTLNLLKMKCLLFGSVKHFKTGKAMVSTTISDGMYYEITYNGDRKESYIDAYKKWENKRVPDAE